MNLPEVLMGVAAGVGIHAALAHGLVGLSRRPRDRVRIAFAVAASAAAVGALAVLAIYSVDNAAAHVAVMKWVFFPASVAWTVAMVWLVAFYADVRPTRWLLALSGGFCAVVAIDLVLPFGLLNEGMGELSAVRIAGAQVRVMSNPSPHPLNYLTDALTLAAFVFLCYAVFRVLRRGERAKAGYLGLIVVFLSLTTLVDTFTDYGIVSSLYLTQLGFVAVVLAVSIALRRESLQAETELRAFRTQLESLVDARVRDLDRANEQLAREIGERLATEEALRRRVAELDSLQHITQTLAGRSDLGGALDAASSEITELFKARYARVHLLRDEAASGADESVTDAGAEGDAPIDAAVVEQAIEQKGFVVVDAPAWPGLQAGLRERVAAQGVGHLLAVPLVASSETVGVLSIARDADGAAFSIGERRLAKTVADALAAVVEIERLHERETKQAAVEERQRLARDLHDAVTQSIYSASLIAEALPAVWERDPDEGLRTLVRLRRLVRAALAEMRTLLFELRPSTLEAAPLDTLLERLGDSLAGQVQLPVDVNVADGLTVPRDVKLAFYRVTQEAFSNIGKHARATRVTVAVDAHGGGASLTVRDDGKGFDSDAVPLEHMGLRIMRERLDRVGASLTIDSAPGRGTTLSVVWHDPGSDGAAPERKGT